MKRELVRNANSGALDQTCWVRDSGEGPNSQFSELFRGFWCSIKSEKHWDEYIHFLQKLFTIVGERLIKRTWFICNAWFLFVIKKSQFRRNFIKRLSPALSLVFETLPSSFSPFLSSFLPSLISFPSFFSFLMCQTLDQVLTVQWWMQTAVSCPLRVYSLAKKTYLNNYTNNYEILIFLSAMVRRYTMSWQCVVEKFKHVCTPSAG